MSAPWSARESARLLEEGVAPRVVRGLLQGRLGVEELEDDVRRVLEQVLAEESRGSAHELIQLGDPRYPRALAATRTPPPVLWGRGAGCEGAALGLRAGVAVVGTRHMEELGDGVPRYGEVVAQVAARAAVACGVPVHSGLALGVDAVAHQAALDAGGESCGVLGGGVDQITPRTNAALGEALLERGGLISEQPPGTGVRPGMLMARNRITVGLSGVVVVAEARAGSGTMGAVWAALEEGRPLVVALPRRSIPGGEIAGLLAADDASGLLALKPPLRARQRLEACVEAGTAAASGVASSREELAEIIQALVMFSPWHEQTDLQG